jgi:Na+/H+ antiporter NhaC
MVEFGVLSLVPPLLAIVLAIATRKPILSLFLGVWAGGVIVAGSPSVALATEWFAGAGVDGTLGELLGSVAGAIVALFWGLNEAFSWLVQSLTDEEDGAFHVQILLFTLLLGSAVALIWRLGGSIAVREYATRRLDTQRKIGLATWVLGLVMFFDDYANTAIVGSTMKDIADELRISREKLSYIVDSTAAPVATLGVSSWVAFQLSMIQTGYDAIDAEGEPTAFETFFASIPFNVYSILAIVMVGLVVLTRRDFGEMLDAEHRAWRTGAVTREDATPLQDVEDELGAPKTDRPMLRSFFVPVAVLIVVALGTAFRTGYAPGAGLLDVAGAADWALALIWGSFAMVASAIAIGLAYRILSLSEAVDTVIDGFGIMLTAVTILVLAWSLGFVANDLGTGEYVAGAATGVVSPAILPVVVLFIAAFIAFSMGSSWATMAILTPIAIPVAFGLTETFELMPAVVGAIFSGAIFGDHTSPISDTTVLSSTFTGADLIDHVRTQFYYAGTVVLVATVCYLLYGYLGLPPIVFLPVGLVLLVALLYAFSEFDARRKGVRPRASAGDRDAADASTDD